MTNRTYKESAMGFGGGRAGKWWRWMALAALAALAAAQGCAMGNKPPVMVKKWVLDYPAPLTAPKPMDAEVKVARFSSAVEITGTDMVYQPYPLRRDTYNYHRWMTDPADMVGDLMLRDLAAEKRLSAAFTYRQPAGARFRLEGGLERFMEVDTDNQWFAEMEVVLTLLDTDQDRLTERLIFQKTYKCSREMPTKDAGGLAKGLSSCMAEVSARARADIYESLDKRLGE